MTGGAARPLRFVAPPSAGAPPARLTARMEWFLRRWLGPGWLVEARVAESYGELAQLLGSGGADIGWTPPLVGARVEALGGRVLVRVVRGGATTFRAAIVCARRRPVEPRALRGLRAAWVDRESTAGYLLPRAWVRSAGADPDRVFASEAFAGTHQAALQMVLDDRADLTGVFAAAASAPPYTALDDLPASDRARLSIVGYTMEAPNDVIMAAPGLDPAWQRELSSRLLAAGDDERGAEMLRELFHAQELAAPTDEGQRGMQDLVLATFGLAPPPSSCAACGARVSATARFCEQCGAPVRAAATPTTDAAPESLPPRSLAPASLPPVSLPPASLAPESMAPPSSDAWSEERKLATVLFGDLTEFTAISAGLEPDRVRELANDCFEPVTAEVERRGGRIVKYIGDGVMAVFGVPLSGEDDPRRAVQAALAIMERISEVSRRTVARYGTPVNMRIGINTGWMMVGSVGARGSASPDVMGWTVNVASRIEGIARPGEVLVGQATYRLVERWFEVESRGPVRLRGVPEPVPVHRVLRERAEEAQPSHRTAGAEPFLRERELAVLEGAFDALARQPRARVVELVGEAGLGKSRLVDELAARLGDDARHPEVLRAAAVLGATDRAAPLSFLERLLRQRFGVRSAEPTPEARARVAAGIARAFGPDDADAGELAAGTLASLIGEPAGDADPAASGAPPEQPAGEDAMLAALAAWVRRLAGDRAACLLCTDLQWADDRSLDVLERLPQALGDAAVLLVLSARRELAERRPRWSEASLPDEAATRIELAPLPAADIRRFLAALLPPGGAPERIVDALVGRAEGSPELARELVRLLVERGAIVLDDEQRPTSWRAERLGQIELPETVQGALQARLDGLPRGERDLLRRAAIVGRVFWRGAVEALGDAGELEGRRSQRPGDPLSVRRDVATALESLERKGLVRRSETSLLDGEPELAFHTQALRDLTYRSIPEKGRQAGHVVVAAWLGDRPGGAGTAQAEVAAHLAAGGDLAAARVAYLAAARRAARVFAHDDAAPLYERALELGDPAGPDRAAVMRELALMRARAGRYDAALAALDDAAAALARQGGDPVAEAWLELDRSRVLKDCGRAEDQRAAIDRALRAVGETAAGGLGVQLWATRAFARLEAGDTAGARADCERGLALGARGEHDAGADLGVWQQAMARLHNTLGGIRLYYDADLSGAEESYHRALALRRAAGDQHGELDALINLGAIAFERRDFTGAAARFGEGLAAARAARWVKYIAVCASNLGQAELAAGDPSAAVERLRQATDLARQAGLLEVLADGTRAMAEALLRKGSAQEALAVADKSIEHARRARIPRFEAAAHAVAMECLLGGARPGQGTAASEARAHLSAAAELLRASGHKSSAAEIAELEAKLERAERGWAPTVVVDRPSNSGAPPSGRGTRS